jgi:hypothetical protein
MKIADYLNNIDVPTNDEVLLRNFIQLKESAIKDSILQMWEDYNLNQPDNFNAEISNPTPLIEDSSLVSNSEISTSSSDLIDNLEVTPITLVEDPSNDSSISQSDLKDDTIVLISTNKTNQNSEVEKITIQDDQKKQTDALNDKKANDAFASKIKSKNMVFPNGKANQEYKFLFNIEELEISEFGTFWFEGLDIIGLNFNLESKEISGIPTIAGDHKVTLKIKRNDWSEGRPIFERETTLIINPDPKTLWKNIPTPTDIEYYKPDCDKSYVKVESVSGIFGTGKSSRKDMVAASQRGRSHAQEGKARDDDFALKYIKEHDWYIMAVADGAGSAKSSRKGSEIACNTVKKVCEQFIKSHHKEFEQLIKEFSSDKTGEKRKKMGDSLYKILGNAVFKSLKNIEEEAKTSGKPTKDFATTLIISICKKFKFGWFVGAFWVGDGGIGIYNKKTNFLKVLGESDGGEFAGQTRFLTMPEITQPAELYRRLRFDIVDDFTALILMTDGVTDPKFETDANLVRLEKWDELWNDLSKEVDLTDDNTTAADQLLSWLDFWSPGNHDDRTIAILY